MSLDDDERRMGAEFLGYGDPAAPYWFVGPEPGGDYDPSWATFWVHELGAQPIFDPRRDPATKRLWFSEGSRLQRPTWQRIIETVMAYEDAPQDDACIFRYQIERFGLPVAAGGQIAAVELSAFAAQSQAHDSPHRHVFLDARLETLRRLIRSAEPRFVVCYGAGHRQAFERFAECVLPVGSVQRCGATLFALAYHPAAARYGRRTDFAGLGRALKKFAGRDGS